MLKKYPIAAVFFICLILGLGIFFKNKIFSNASPKTIESPVIGLDQFYKWVKEDPLFSGPDFDDSSFSSLVNALEKEEKAVQEYLKVTDPLYPIVFLKDVLEVNRINRDFLNSRSAKSARELISVYQKTVQDYQASQEALAKILHNEKLFPPETFFLGINTSVSFKTIIDDVDRLGLNAKELKKEIDIREECLKTGKGCLIPSDNFVFEELQNTGPKFSKADFLSKDILFPGRIKDAAQFGPYLVSTPCFGWTKDLQPKTYPFYVSEKMNLRVGDGLMGQNLKLANTSYYKRLVTDPAGAGAYLLKSNSEWVKQRETQLYMCNDPRYEINLVVLDKFYQKYKNALLFEKIDDESLSSEMRELIKQGNLLEEKFFKSEFSSETDLENLASFYGYFYKISGKEITNRDDFLIRNLEYRRKLGNMTSILTNALKNIQQLRVRFEIAESAKNNYSYIYGFRSFYGLYYLTFSPSFYRLKEPLNFLDKKVVDIPYESKGAHITYQQALQNYTPEEISKWNINNRELLDEAIEEYKAKHPGTKI